VKNFLKTGRGEGGGGGGGGGLDSGVVNSPLCSVTRNLVFCLNPSQRNFLEHVIMRMEQD